MHIVSTSNDDTDYGSQSLIKIYLRNSRALGGYRGMEICGSTENHRKNKNGGQAMARMTIAQLRAREVDRLVLFKTKHPTEGDYEEARRNMNSFYRLCGLSETNLYLSNNERSANSRYTKESEAREDRWFKRLDKTFKDTYGLRLVYCGYAPSIGEKLEHGGFSEKISRYFYD